MHHPVSLEPTIVDSSASIVTDAAPSSTATKITSSTTAAATSSIAGIRPTLDEVRELASSGEYDLIPVSMELLADIKTPVETLKVLQNVSNHCFLFESAEEHERWGRYTFLGFDPKLCITCSDGQMKVGSLTFSTDDPSSYLRQILAEHRSPRLPYLPAFTGGLVGYFSYDYIKYAEPTLDLDARDTEGFKDVDLMLFDRVVAFDHLRQKIALIANMEVDDVDASYHRAEISLREMRDLLIHGKARQPGPSHLTTPITPLFTEKEYCEMVERAKRNIREGDIFQIVLSNRLEAGFTGSLLDTYRVLRTINPSPYLFYLCGTDVEVAGASPETLVKLEDGIVHTFPLAGTRPRGRTPKEDEELEAGLLADPKELAEHNMLVDLGRNDLGRISEFGSVRMERYHEVLRFSHVMHIGSTVRGELRAGYDALDAIEAVLPAGTLSGAPKIRACQLINDLEGNKRGIYGGAIGYIGFTGNLDTCIGIRIAYKKNGKVFIRSGAGIVADSIPQNEYRECMNKAAAVVEALETAQTLLGDPGTIDLAGGIDKRHGTDGHDDEEAEA